jgi:cytochrome c556
MMNPLDLTQKSLQEDLRMRRLLMTVTAIFVALAGTVAVAQKVTTPMELDATMKKISQAQGATAKAIQAGDFAAAKASVAIVKAALMDAENFWVMHKKDEAIAFSKDAMAKVTAVETAVSAAMPDQMAALAAQKTAGGACGACHKTFREQDANMQYQLKAGTI